MCVYACPIPSVGVPCGALGVDRTLKRVYESWQSIPVAFGQKVWMAMVRTAVRVITLLLCAIVGLWAVGHGIALAAMARAQSHEDMLQYLLEVSVSIAGGICVLSVAIEQLQCWRTRRKDGGLI